MILTQRNSVLAFVIAFLSSILLFAGFFTTRPEEIATDLGGSIFILCTSLVLIVSLVFGIVAFVAEIHYGEPFSWVLFFTRGILSLFILIYVSETFPLVNRLLLELIY